MTRSLLVGLLAVLLATCACGNNNASTTAPTTTTDSRLVEVFSGDLSSGQVAFFPFIVTGTGTSSITLASVRPVGSSTATLNTTLGLAIGLTSDAGCDVISGLNTPPGLVAQINYNSTAQSYCAEIYDIGALRDPVSFSIRVNHP